MGGDGYDKGEHVKELFAYFGRAYYMANVFETGLALSVLHLDFLTEMAIKIKREGKDNFDRSAYEAKFDAFMSKQHAQTLGNLLKRLHELADVGADLQSVLSETKTSRDFIAHHFFRERADAFASRTGRDKMIEELESAHDLFKRADRALEEFMGPYLKRHGITKDLIEAETERHLRSLEANDRDA
ncbi:hypothetical protein [Methylocystis iwaonis]|uniref:hypothetical protein n=1 Tax=Methylocystis iwaonis TaxID=2885079 RepID=UPI002E7C1820|nr:hypothetical protein [Methylocystis iwaonis]